jgi:hypothetical protein
VFSYAELNASLRMINTYKHHQTFDPVEVLVHHVGKTQDFRMLWELVCVAQIRAAARRALAASDQHTGQPPGAISLFPSTTENVHA